jgi:hypothetical protein
MVSGAAFKQPIGCRLWSQALGNLAVSLINEMQIAGGENLRISRPGERHVGNHHTAERPRGNRSKCGGLG